MAAAAALVFGAPLLEGPACRLWTVFLLAVIRLFDDRGGFDLDQEVRFP